ncbi:type III-B CRISPR-associated protein Cas10/Cmr2 [Desulfobulbus sp. US4]|nr:type III-B CRISPR-associated protein Cas10/Cmr2 [Desulfobulbus sp. US4]
MSQEQQTLHFAFGPVQDFVSQARRTRDLWAGSYLLSWLAGQAIHALEKKGGEVIMPEVKQDALLQQIRNPQPINFDNPASYLGSLPNRFTASVPAEVDGRVCTEAIHVHWKKVTDAVFALIEKNLDPLSDQIWQRQTQPKNFWECTWVLGEASYLLNQRKNFRVHFPSEEPGEKCTVCGEREEISAQPNRKTSKVWWQKLSSIKKIHGLDLGENERLCAVCLSKRLFPHIAQQAIDWQVPEFYPSTLYMSAVDWIIHVLNLAKDKGDVRQAAEQFLNTVKDRVIQCAEKQTWDKIAGIKELVESDRKLKGLEKFQYVDGAVFYQDALLRKDLKISNRSEVIKGLQKLQNAVQKYPPSKHTSATASPFYALLLMDGDNMGSLISNCSEDERHQISIALTAFTQEVPAIVRQHNGMLLYAGGDDVFALLPVSTALECARLCRRAYQCSFKENAPFVLEAQATLSAAVQYVQMTTALGVVVRDAHILLDTIAKDSTGRDALACRVWKRGGPILTWAQPWSKIDDGTLIETVLEGFTDETVGFSSKFFYTLPNLFDLVNAEGFPGNEQDIQDLLIAEYLANREHDWNDPSEPNKKLSQPEILKIAEERTGQLRHLCQEWKRTVTEQGKASFEPKKHSNSAALLIRFLAQKEI